MTDKQYYRIKDVSEILGVPQSTLRFWEKEFPSCKPTRSATNIRYYKPSDIEQLRIIYFLVKVKGLKIDAAREQLRLNRNNISRRLEVIDRLGDIRKRLDHLLKSLSRRQSAEHQPNDNIITTEDFD